MTTLPTCPREDCTFTGPHHDHNKRTGKVRDRAEVSDCQHAETAYHSPCYAPRTPQPQPAAVVLPTVDEVADIIKAGGFYSDTAQAVLDLIAARLPVWQPVEPADVRVGDRVRVEWKPEDATVTDVVDSDVGLLADYGAIIWVSLTGDRHDRADLYLIDRPEPEDPRVAVVVGYFGTSDDLARDLLARLDAARTVS